MRDHVNLFDVFLSCFRIGVSFALLPSLIGLTAIANAMPAQTDTDPDPMPLMHNNPNLNQNSLTNAAQATNDLVNATRHAALALIPPVPAYLHDTLHDVTHEATQDLRAVGEVFGMSDLFAGRSSQSGENKGSASFFATLWQPPEPSAREALWLTPDYNHHDGIMPWHDALLLGTRYHRQFLDDRARMEVNPFVGPGLSGGAMWGTEATLNITRQRDHQDSSGLKFSVSYKDGDAALTGDKRGYDAHGDWQINNQLSFSFGAASSASDNKNYALLRWQMKLGEGR